MNKPVLFLLLFGWMHITARCQQHTTAGLLFYKGANGKNIPVRNKADWQKKRQQILDSMQAAMGPVPARDHLPPFNIQFTDSFPSKFYTRYSILFFVAANEQLSANLYIPHQQRANQQFPAMIALHETDSIGKRSVDGQGSNQNLAYGKELAERGYIVIAPDYPSFGELKDYDFNNSGYRSGVMKSIFDNMRCVDLLLSRNDVEKEHIGIIGHSLGGHTAMFTAAFDERLKVVVASCGWTLFDYYNIGAEAENIYGGRLGPWAQPRYMPLLKEKYQLDPKKIPFDFGEVIAAIAPRSFFSSSPLKDGNFNVIGVKAGMKKAQPVYRFFEAENSLKFSFPDCGHDFPTTARLHAYEFIAQTFRGIK